MLHTRHPSQIVATSDGFTLDKTHADRFTGKCVAVVDARKKIIWNRYGLDSARTRRGMILRQPDDNKCMWLDTCKTNPCITAFVAINSHSSQAVASGAHDSSNQDGLQIKPHMRSPCSSHSKVYAPLMRN